MVTLAHKDLSLDSIHGFVTCSSGGKWWLGCVIELFQEDDSAKLTFLHPHGPSSSFKYPAFPDIRIIPTNDIMTAVDPRTTTGCIYTLTRKEISSANEKFRQTSVN